MSSCTNQQVIDTPHSIKPQLSIHFIGVTLLFINLAGSHIFNKVDYFKLSILAVALCVLFASLLTQPRRLNKFRSLPLLFAFAMIPSITTLPGLIFSGHPYLHGALYESCSRILLAFWFGACVYLIRPHARYGTLINWLVLILMYVCIIAILESKGLTPQLLLGFKGIDEYALNIPVTFNGEVQRVASTFGNPNYFSAFVVMLLPVIFASLAATLKLNTKKYFLLYVCSIIAVILLSIYSLTLAGTRGALASLIAASLLCIVGFSIILPRNRTFIAFAILAGLSLLIVAILSHDSLANRVDNLTDSKSWSARISTWKVAVSSIYASASIGHGIGASYPLFFEFVPPDWRLFRGERSFNHAHNQWFEVLQEGGILGLLGYAAFWITIIYFSIRIIRHSAHLDFRLYACGILCGLVAYHLHSLVSVAQRMVIVNSLAYFMSAWIIAMAWRENLIFSTLLTKIHIATSWLRLGSYTLIANITLAAVFLTSIIWLVSFLNPQNILARVKAGTLPNSALTQIANTSKDAYILNEAIMHLHNNQDYQALYKVADRLQEAFPHYREVNYWLALSLWKRGETERARNVIDDSIRHDGYFPQSLHLRMAIALYEKDNSALISFAQKLITLRACKKLRTPCSESMVEVLIRQLPNGFVLFDNTKDNLNVIFSDLLTNQLSNMSGRTTKVTELKPLFIEVAKNIGNQPFFTPQLVFENASLDQHQYSLLGEYISKTKRLQDLNPSHYVAVSDKPHSLAEHRNSYYQWKHQKQAQQMQLRQDLSLLKKELKKTIKLDQFMQRRAFLHLFVSDLMSTTELLLQFNPQPTSH